MSVPSVNYIDKVKRWIVSGLDLDRFNMRTDQKFRAQLVSEAFHFWMKDRTQRPQTLLQNIAAKHYALLLRQAKTEDPAAVEYVSALHIVEGIGRSPAELANDLYVLNRIVDELSVASKAIHKAAYEENAYWMMKFGRNCGDWRAVAKANDQLAMLNNDFKSEESAADQMPNTNINITGDVGVVKEGRESLTDEERARLRKKYGLTEKEYAQEMEEINGVWQPATDDDDPDNQKDFFEKAEEGL